MPGISNFNHRIMRIAYLAALTLISAPGSAQNTVTRETLPLITVSARGEVKVAPDRAAIQIAVLTRAATAAAAASENATKLKAVMDALRAMGLGPSQVTTINYNVYPQQRHEPNREPVITGYNVSNTLLVEVRTLSQVGPVIDAALAKGANSVTSLQFTASNTDAARREAIALAIQKARGEAEAAARAAGGTLGGVIEIAVGSFYQPPRPMMMARGAATMEFQSDTPINPGDQTVSVDVTTRWNFIGSR